MQPHHLPDVAKLEARGGSFLLAVPDADTDYIQGRVRAEGRAYEEALLEDMVGRVRPGDVVVDVGANVGNHTMYLACLGECRVHAFEPNAHLAAAIEESARLNGVSDRVHVHQQGAAAMSGVGSLILDDPGNLGGQRIVLEETADGERVSLVALDQVPLGSRVAVVKVDVEGMEMEVLAGATALLARERPLLYVECLDVDQFSRVEAFVGKHGYVWGDVFNASPTHLFLPSDRLSSPEELRDVLRRRALAEYTLRDAAAADRRALNAANKRYRELYAHAAKGSPPEGRHDLAALELSAQLEAARAELRSVHDELEKAKRAHGSQSVAYDHTMVQLRSVAGQVDEAGAALEARDRQLRTQRKRVKELRGALATKRRSLRARTTTSSARISELEAALAEAQSRLDAAARRSVQVKADLKVVRGHIDEVASRLESTEARATAAEEGLAKAAAEAEHHAAHAAQLDARGRELAQQIDELSLRRDELQVSNAGLAASNAKLAADVRSRTKDLAATRRARDRYLQEKADAAEAFAERLTVLTAERDRLEADLAVATLAVTWESRGRAERHEELMALRRSATYRAGVAVRNARSPKGLAKLVPALWASWKSRPSEGDR